MTVLGYDYWRRRFESNPAVLNDTLIINGQAFTIVGVAPQGFEGTTLGRIPDVYVPMTMRAVRYVDELAADPRLAAAGAEEDLEETPDLADVEIEE